MKELWVGDDMVIGGIWVFGGWNVAI